MILPDRVLRKKSGQWFPDGVHIGPSSVDFRLGDQYLLPNPELEISLGKELPYRKTVASSFLLLPRQFCLATTEEWVELPEDVAAFVSGRSSIGRLGLQVQNAGFIDAGFMGQITLELANQTPFPIRLQAGVRICQIVFMQQLRKSREPYSGKYLAQVGVCGSLQHLDEE